MKTEQGAESYAEKNGPNWAKKTSLKKGKIWKMDKKNDKHLLSNLKMSSKYFHCMSNKLK